MESVDHFYLTLPSSASLDLHPDNKLSDFTTVLMNPLQLKREEYEVGLCEMILNTDIENLPHNLFWMVVYRSVECVETILQVEDTRNLKRTIIAKKVNTTTFATREYFFEEFALRRAYFKSVPAIFGHLNDLFDMSIMCKDLVYKTEMRTYEDKVIISLSSKVSVNLRDRDMFFLRRSPWQRKHIRRRDAELDILHDIPTMLKRVILSVAVSYTHLTLPTS